MLVLALELALACSLALELDIASLSSSLSYSTRASSMALGGSRMGALVCTEGASMYMLIHAHTCSHMFTLAHACSQVRLS